VNLWLVTALKAPWLLVADIERGGVFASVIGTVQLLTPEERGLFRGFAINKFRGDLTLFDQGMQMLEERIASRCLGVFPYLADVELDPEDSLAVRTAPSRPAPPGARIAIVRFPLLSNATDFSLIDWAEWMTSPSPERFDFVILPGSKNTIADLAWLRQTGLADWILEQHRRGTTVVGICGGYQMMGQSIADPGGMESPAGRADGLALIAAHTVLASEKTTRAVAAVTPGGVRFGAYEIHLGITTLDPTAGFAPFATIGADGADGVRGAGVLGTYLHGAFESPGVCAEVFGIKTPSTVSKSSHYRRMAEWFDQHARHVAELGLD
jgi:adenosylcobyric acid synthase